MDLLGANAVDASSRARSVALDTLGSEIRRVDDLLQHHVIAHKGQLLAQTSRIDHINADAIQLAQRISLIQARVKSLKNELLEPFCELKSLSSLISINQAEQDLLLAILTVYNAYSRINVDATNFELALSISQAEASFKRHPELNEILIISKLRPFIISSANDLRETTFRSLKLALKDNAITKTANALLVFHQLNELASRVEQQIAISLSSISKSLSHALDEVKADSSKLSSAFWRNMIGFVDSAVDLISQISTLRLVLIKHRDPISHAPLYDFVTSNSSCFDDFWRLLANAISTTLSSSSQSSSFVHSLLINEFPYLFNIMEQLTSRVSALLIDRSFLDSSSIDTINSSISRYHSAYTSRLLSKFNEPITLMFRSTTYLPSKHDLELFISVVRTELDIVSRVPKMQQFVLDTLLSATTIFSEKCLARLKSTDRGFEQDLSIYALAHHLFKKLHVFFNLYTSDLKKKASKTLDLVDKKLISVFEGAFALPLKQLHVAFEEVLYTIHSLDFSSHMNVSATKSQYIVDLRSLVEHFIRERVSLFPDCTTLCNSQIRHTLQHLFLLFISHASLISPLSEEGSLLLANDASQLSQIASLFFPIQSNDMILAPIQAFKRLLFADTRDIPDSKDCSLLPHYIIIHMLLARVVSRSVKQPESGRPITLPHIILDWSHRKYMKFLELKPNDVVSLLCKVTRQPLDSSTEDIIRAIVEFINQ